MDKVLSSLYTAIEMARTTPDAPAYVVRRLEEIEWGVDALAAENARLTAVVEAARAIVADADSPQLARNWATDRLATALAAVEEVNGE